MAITATVPTNATVYSGTDATSYSTGSWTPASGARSYVAFVEAIKIGGADTPSLSGNGLTWTLERTGGTWDGGNRRCWMFRASGTASSGATTASFGANTQLGASIIVVEVDDVDAATNNGVVQSAANQAESGTTHDATLAAFGSAQNAVICFCAEDDNGEPAEEGGYTSLANGTHASPNVAMRVAYKVGEDTSPSMTGSNVAWAVIACEMKANVASADLAMYVGLGIGI